jgi:hypothetical protein
MADGSVRPMLGDAVFNDRRHHDLVGFLIGATATGPAAQSATNPKGPMGSSSDLQIIAVGRSRDA